MKGNLTFMIFNSQNMSFKLFSYRLITEYRKLFANMPTTTQLHEISEDMDTYILNLSKTLITRVNAQYIVGATITANNITAWFNNQPYHGAPLALNLLHNAMLNALDCVNCGIKVSNHPMPFLTVSRVSGLHLEICFLFLNFS